MSTQRDITQTLAAWRAGDPEAASELLPLVYDELHRIAQLRMHGERSGHTLQATALVNEAYMRLVDLDLDFQNRSHFLALASETMRRVLIDHARGKGRKKRDGGIQVTLDEVQAVVPEVSVDILDLDAALKELEEVDPRKAKALTFSFFGGLKIEEIATVLDVGVATVKRDLRFAKAWLNKRLQPSG